MCWRTISLKLEIDEISSYHGGECKDDLSSGILRRVGAGRLVLVMERDLVLALRPVACCLSPDESGCDRESERDRVGLTPNLTKRDLWRSRRWAIGNEDFLYSSLWDFNSTFTSRKILRHGTFRIYFPSERKVCCGFLSPLKIHRLGGVRPATFGFSGKHTNHYTAKATVGAGTNWPTFWLSSFIHFPLGSQLEHRAHSGVSLTTHTIRHTVGLLWMSDQPVSETSTYTGQHSI
jgi:hypothetical protein